MFGKKEKNKRQPGFWKIFFCLLIILSALIYVMSFRKVPEEVRYGVSFSKLHAEELGLDWKKTYLSVLDDLKVKHLRLSAHWPMIEPDKDRYDWSVLDLEMDEARAHGADVILAIGRRLPGWPECHVPNWAVNMTEGKKREEILSLVSETVKRYKDYPNLRYWQVENEDFLRFATQYCPSGDEGFLQEEIALVRKIDPNHKILVTDSGEMGLWYKARRNGDVFGTSVYLYIWHDVLGAMRYPIRPGFFAFKQNFMDFIYGPKETVLIELGAEPWLTTPIIKAPIELQLNKMGIDKWNEVVNFAKDSGFDEQYLWGAEWWYYMKENNHPEFWDSAKKLFVKSS